MPSAQTTNPGKRRGEETRQGWKKALETFFDVAEFFWCQLCWMSKSSQCLPGGYIVTHSLCTSSSGNTLLHADPVIIIAFLRVSYSEREETMWNGDPDFGLVPHCFVTLVRRKRWRLVPPSCVVPKCPCQLSCHHTYAGSLINISRKCRLTQNENQI